MYKLKRIGLKMDPWDALQQIGTDDDKYSPIYIEKDLSDK